MIENVETLDDPRLDAFARLTEAQLRSKQAGAGESAVHRRVGQGD